MNDIDDMPSKCRDCPYWEMAEKPYVCCDCREGHFKQKGGDAMQTEDGEYVMMSYPRQ